MHTCAACTGETSNVVWVPRLPRGGMPFCTKPACIRAAQRRAAVVFRHRLSEATRAPVPG